MKLKHRFLSAIAATAVVCSSFIMPALAQDAVLRASDPTAEINVRAGASTTANVVSYGVVGDRVRILNETRSSDGFTWYQVRFYDSGETGWVRGDFIRPVAENPNPSPTPTPTPNPTPNPSSPEGAALRSCQTYVQRESPNARVQVVLDSRDRNGLYRINWTTSDGLVGYCRVNPQGMVVAFETTGTVGTPSNDLERRRRQLQTELSDSVIGLRRDQAIQVLRQQGYNPIDNGRGSLTFSADRGIYPVTITYNTQTSFVGQVQVLNRDDTPTTPNPQTEARRQQLETEISELIVKLYNDEAVPILRRRGYAPTDNGRGSITFPVEQGRYSVTATYNTRTFLVERVQASVGTVGTDPNNTGETVASFQTQTYTVRIFRRNDQLLMNVYNKRTQRQELNGVAAIATRTSQGTTYSNETGTLGYYVRVGSNNRYRLDVYSNTGQVAGEDSI